MKKIVAAFLVCSLAAGVYFSMKGDKIKEEVLVPEGYEGGCSYIVYDIENASKLELKDNTIAYKLNENGVLVTSSPQHFGWDNEKISPNLDRHYYYVSKNGDKKEISQDNIQHEGNGSASKEGTGELTFRHFYLGSEEEVKKLEKASNGLGCLNYDEVVKKLNEK